MLLGVIFLWLPYSGLTQGLPLQLELLGNGLIEKRLGVFTRQYILGVGKIEKLLSKVFNLKSKMV
jgi:hypothetical protein